MTQNVIVSNADVQTFRARVSHQQTRVAHPLQCGWCISSRLPGLEPFSGLKFCRLTFTPYAYTNLLSTSSFQPLRTHPLPTHVIPTRPLTCPSEEEVLNIDV